MIAQNFIADRDATHLGRAHRSTYPGPGWNVAAVASSEQPHEIGDAEFVAVRTGFRAGGGLASGDELALRLHVLGEGGYARLARWVVARQVFSFAWSGNFWLPMFQFNSKDLSLQAGLAPVLAELADVMDGWAMAQWFTEVNVALQGQSPVQAWHQRWSDVFEAARMQRYVLMG